MTLVPSSDLVAVYAKIEMIDRRAEEECAQELRNSSATILFASKQR
jgi:hypothetical protein